MEDVNILNDVFGYLNKENFQEQIFDITHNDRLQPLDTLKELSKAILERKKQLENIKDKLIKVNNNTLKDSTSRELLAKINDAIDSISLVNDNLEKMINGDIPLDAENYGKLGSAIDKMNSDDKSMNSKASEAYEEYQENLVKMAKEDPEKLEELKHMMEHDMDEALKEDIQETIDIIENQTEKVEDETKETVEQPIDGAEVTAAVVAGTSDVSTVTSNGDNEISNGDETLDAQNNSENDDESNDAEAEEDEEELETENAVKEENGEIEAEISADGENLEKDENVEDKTQQQTHTEQDSMKNKKGKKTGSLDERLRSVMYTQGVNYTDEVHKIRVEYEIEQVESQLKSINEAVEEYKAQGKRVPYKLAVTKQSLETQLAKLRNEYEVIDMSKSTARKENKLAKDYDKYSEQQAKMNAEKLKEEQAKSKFFKNISLRREKKIQAKLDELGNKMTVVMEGQMTKTTMKFDKQNKKIIKKANKKAKKEVREAIIKEEIERLKNNATAFVTEVKAIGSDFKARFVSRHEQIQEMQNQEIIFIALPATLNVDDLVEENEASLQRAA